MVSKYGIMAGKQLENSILPGPGPEILINNGRRNTPHMVSKYGIMGPDQNPVR